MDLVIERRRFGWRQGIFVDSTDAAEKALRHGRFDLFYGPFYLRFTQGIKEDGCIRLRLEELARLVDAGPGGPELRPARRAPSRFVLEEVLPGASAPRAPTVPLDSGRRFFALAARLLDDSAAEGSRLP